MNISIKNLLLTVAFSLSYMTSYCIDPHVQQENAAAQRRAATAQRRATRAYDRIERRVRNQWVEHLSEQQIRTFIAAEQSNFALREAGRLNLPVIPTALLRNGVNTQQAAVNVVRYVLGTNLQPTSEESKTT